MGEIFEYFKNQTYSQISARLNQYGQQAAQLLQIIEQKEAKLASQKKFQAKTNEYNILDSLERKQHHWIQGSEQLQAIESYLIDKREQIQLNKAYLDGYKLLNEIGHYINQESWDYTIVLFGEQNVTLSLPMEEFLKFTHFTTEGVVLDSKASILGRLAEIEQGTITNWESGQDQQGNKLFNTSEYNISAYKDYQYVLNRAKAILSQGHADLKIASYNQGQRLEGYLAYMENEETRADNIARLSAIRYIAFHQSVKHLGGSDFTDLHNMILDVLMAIQKQTNTRGFWSGGDVQKYGQIKGENASVFSFSTIRNQLKRVSLLLTTLDWSALQEGIERAGPQAKSILKSIAQHKLSEVIDVFNTTKIAKDGGDFNLLDSEIDAIINEWMGK